MTTQAVGALNVINRKIGGNPVQKRATTDIRGLELGSPPFVVFGKLVSSPARQATLRATLSPITL